MKELEAERAREWWFIFLYFFYLAICCFELVSKWTEVEKTHHERAFCSRARRNSSRVGVLQSETARRRRNRRPNAIEGSDNVQMALAEAEVGVEVGVGAAGDLGEAGADELEAGA